MNKKAYLDYIQQAHLKGRKVYDEQIQKWKDDFDPFFMFGYTSPGIIASQIHMEGLLYALTKDKEHAEWVKKGLLQVMDLADIFPEEVRKERVEYDKGVPLLEPLFQLHAYMNAYLYIKDSGILSQEEIKTVHQAIAQSVETLMYSPEWGAHNRSMLRACAFVQANEIVHGGSDTRDWKKMADYLAEESMGRWSIEDATHYIPLWLFACIVYAKWTNTEKEYYAQPQTKFYFDYITRLITPEGNIPGFGDSWFHSNWHIWTACVEMGATQYQCPKMKAAAEKIFQFGQKVHGLEPEPGIGSYCVYAYEWSDDEVPVGTLSTKSEDLDELVGKKIIFRDQDGYMLYNYRDEGDYGKIPRRYLRTSIPVKAEKMHHGHGDEQSIAHLEKQGNVLLHESGYRERLPNGKYRDGIYHNKLVFRKGIQDIEKSGYEALHDEGYYKKVTTEKLHFQSFDKADYLRTRNHYLPLDLIWDRAITYLSEEDVYIVIDWVDGLKGKELTIGNVWHTQYATQKEEMTIETKIDTICRGQNDQNPWKNKQEHLLYIEWLIQKPSQHIETIKRNHGEGTMISQLIGKKFDQDREIFVTVLRSHKRSESSTYQSQCVTIEKQDEKGTYIGLKFQGKDTYHLCYKLDLDRNLIHYEEDRAPLYDWDTGKVDYGTITTDADFAFVQNADDHYAYGMVNGCRIYHGQKPVFKALRYTARDYLMETFGLIDHKWRAWEGETKK